MSSVLLSDDFLSLELSDIESLLSPFDGLLFGGLHVSELPVWELLSTVELRVCGLLLVPLLVGEAY